MEIICCGILLKLRARESGVCATAPRAVDYCVARALMALSYAKQTIFSHSFPREIKKGNKENFHWFHDFNFNHIAAIN